MRRPRWRGWSAVVLAALVTVRCGAPAAATGGEAGPSPAPVPPEADGFLFTFAPPSGAPAVQSVAVAGSFNGWSTSALPMARQPDGRWTARLRLPPGQHEYKYHINGTWPADMCDDRTWGDGARQQWVDPQALGCAPDGFGGQNAVAGVGIVSWKKRLPFRVASDASALSL